MVDPEKKNDIDIFRIKYNSNKDWEQWVLLMSDEHFDSKHCDRKLLKKHHEQAKERGAIVFKIGDVFDMMGGKYDPRSNKEDLRPEYQKADYFSALSKDAAKWFLPYKKNIKFISTGNHEMSVLQRHEVDVLGDFCERLGLKKKPYSGFVRFQFESLSKGGRKSILLYYNHGSGGNSPVTRGVIKTNRRQNYIKSDIFVSGHIHNEWVVSLPMVEVTSEGNIIKREQTHISLGTYKDDSFTGGWADTKEFPPPNMGGVWLRFFYDKKKLIDFEVIRAN